MKRKALKLEVDLQRLRGLRLIDDDFMSKCFEDDIECTELVLQIVIGKKDLRVEKVQTQRSIKNLQGRSVILDILASDGMGKKYNIEVQRSDRGAGARRARYNSSVIDANIICPGDDYEELLETYVIFITERDAIGKNLPIYHIDRTIAETGEYFGDGSHIIYVNGECRDDSPLGILMQDFFCTNPADMKYKALADKARYFKEDEEGVAAMCRMMEEMRNEADLAARRKVAGSLLTLDKLSYEEIAKCAGLTVEEVQKLAGKKGV